ncbi:MAG: hypothetical protein M3224_03845, partial [Thermoproteota archaeon]|nr:hypothetical protein [Thermoproteota archaeon]
MQIVVPLVAVMIALLTSQYPVMAQQQQQQNSTVVDLVSANDSLSLNSIFKEVENSVVQITRKVPP